jgi:hypothetical protein
MLIICSFLAGIAISYVPLYRQSKYRLEVDFVKGAAVALVTLFLVGTPMALLAFFSTPFMVPAPGFSAMFLSRGTPLLLFSHFAATNVFHGQERCIHPL